jgi:replicative DNA helicase
VSTKKKPAPTADEAVPPHDLAAERGLLGAILLEGRSGFEKALAAGVRDEHFFSAPNAAIFRAMARLHARGGPVEIAAMRGDLEDAGELVLVGGPAGLGTIIE